MTTSKQEAVKKIKDQVKKEYLAALNGYCSNLEVLDELPSWGCYYWAQKGGKEDYWYIEAAKPNMLPQTGGNTKYWTIHKKTGEISSIVVTGE